MLYYSARQQGARGPFPPPSSVPTLLGGRCGTPLGPLTAHLLESWLMRVVAGSRDPASPLDPGFPESGWLGAVR